ncbi:MAG: radical SAM protein [Desulfovibrionaceae bacterium]|nr:radical SAM protein [Desulfovibrionaceae bacterium]
MLVLLRSTTACNLRCRYCSVDCESSGQSLTEEDCRLLVRYLPELVPKGEPITYLWHGGEPTLLGPQHFLALHSILGSVADCGYTVRSLMQTNGYALSDAWVDALKDCDVSLGVSLDGPESFHDAVRCTSGGQGSYARVLANVERLRSRGVSVALLCTVRPEHLGNERALVQWMRDLDLPVRVNPLLKFGRSSQELSLDAYFAFLRTILTLSLELGIRRSIEPLNWMLDSLIGETEPSECSYSGHCARSLFVYGPGGEVGACNRSDTRFGSLSEASLVHLWETDPWKTRRGRLDRLRQTCASCPAWRFCHGGCPDVEGESPDPLRCAARRDFFAWLRVEGLALYKESLLRHREFLRDRLRVLRKAKEYVASELNAGRAQDKAGG